VKFAPSDAIAHRFGLNYLRSHISGSRERGPRGRGDLAPVGPRAHELPDVDMSALRDRRWHSSARREPRQRSFANEGSNAPKSGADCEKYRDKPDEDVIGERDRHNCRIAKLRRRESNDEDFPSSVSSALS
jgi:hypothetical protein